MNAGNRIGLVISVVARNYILVSLLAVLVLFGSLSDQFFTGRTFVAILSQLPVLALVSVGITLVLIVGGIDLSVGSVLALSSAIIGVAMSTWGMDMYVALLFGSLAGVACGAFNGVLISYFGIPSFIVSLGTLEISRGLAYIVTDSQTLYIGTAIFGLAQPVEGFGFSPALLVALTAVILFEFVLRRTVFGRQIIAIGSNSNAARMSGIATKQKRFLVYVLCGLLAGIGGGISASYIGSADPNVGVGLELSAIAAAVIGGTSLLGGRGSVFGALVGVLIIVVLDVGLAQLGVTEPSKRLITGAVIVSAVLIDRWRNLDSY